MQMKNLLYIIITFHRCFLSTILVLKYLFAAVGIRFNRSFSLRVDISPLMSPRSQIQRLADLALESDICSVKKAKGYLS